MDYSWYKKEVERQLSDTATYKPVLPSDLPTQEIYNKITNLGQHAFDIGLITQQQLSFLKQKVTPLTATPPQIYIIPKVHKEPLKGRPIIPGFNWITYPASVLVDHLLQPLLKRIPTVLSDSKSLLIQIENTKFTTDIELITADVSSLYTEIDLKKGINFVRQLIRENSDENYSSEMQDPLFSNSQVIFICDLLSLVMNNNYFHFNGQYYHQIKGTAMGTPAAVVFANLFMHILERNVLKRYPNLVYLYKRYLDDLLLVVSPEISSKIKASLQSMERNIKLEFSDSPDSATFLDLIIFKGSRFHSQSTLDVKVHQKALNAYLYIPYKSFHPTNVKKGFIKTELQRYIRNCSAQEDYIVLKNLFWYRLRARGYPISFLTNIFNQIWYYKDRPRLLQMNPKPSSASPSDVFFTTEYNTLTNHLPLKEILMNSFPPTIKDPIHPRIGFKKSSNLGSILCQNRSLQGEPPPTGR